jgi:F420H(2)-dependent biliverdin reductase
VALDPGALPPAVQDFLAERHLATLTTLRPDGSPHVVAVGFTWDGEARVVRVITSRGSAKVRHARAGGRAVVCQVEGRRWVSLEGTVEVHDDPASVAEGEAHYAVRYRTPRENPERVVLLIRVDRVLGTVRGA